VRPCPSCGREDLEILVPCETVAREMQLRSRFYRERIDGRVDRAMQKDLMDVAHLAEAEIAICRDCEILVRRERESPKFETDHYEPFAMERMLKGARVLEIGSYLGGFLHVATEWGWNAVGVVFIWNTFEQLDNPKRILVPAPLRLFGAVTAAIAVAERFHGDRGAYRSAYRSRHPTVDGHCKTRGIATPEHAAKSVDRGDVLAPQSAGGIYAGKRNN
jgi:hypothetical protein